MNILPKKTWWFADKDKLGDVAFFASVNLPNPASLWDVSVNYVEGSCWLHKKFFVVGNWLVFIKGEINHLKNSLEVEAGQKPKTV